MAQRRSKNRRLSARRSINGSGILNNDTNVVDDDDPLWFDRTNVRPSMSFLISRRESTFLSPGSSVGSSALSDKWYNNLSRSDTSKLIEAAAAAQKSNDNQLNKEQGHTTFTESESDGEPKKKRANFRFNKKNTNDTTNVFLKALDSTSDSHATKNLTHPQIPDVIESETSADDSKTIQRLRPRLFRNNKTVENNTNKFDEVFKNSSIETTLSNSASKRTSENVENTSNIKSIEKLQKRSERIQTNNSSLNKQSQESSLNEFHDVDEAIINKSNKNLKNKTPDQLVPKRTVPKITLSKSNLSEQQTIEYSTSNDTADSNVSKKRSALFSQKRKSKPDKNLFAAAFDSDNDEMVKNSQEKEVTNLEEVVETSNKNNEDDNVSESSSIPKNIRRTRSYSIFARKESDDEIQGPDQSSKSVKNKSVSNENLERVSGPIQMIAFDDIDEENLYDVPSKKSKTSDHDKSKSQTVNQVDKSTKSLKNKSINNEASKQVSSRMVLEESDDENIYDVPNRSSVNSKQINDREKSKNKTSNQKSNLEANDISESSSIPKNIRRTRSYSTFAHKDSDNEIQSPNQSSKNLNNKSVGNENSEQASGPVQMTLEDSDEENMYDVPSKKSKINESEKSQNQKSAKKKTNTSKSGSLNKTKNSLINKTNSTKSKSILDYIDRDQTNKSVDNLNKTRSQQLKNKSIAGNVTKTLTETSTDSTHKSPTKKSLNASSARVSSSQENLESEGASEQDENDADTSSMPKNIRRTMSRIFQKSKATDTTPDVSENLAPSNPSRMSNDSLKSNSSPKKRQSVLNVISNQSSPKILASPVIRLQRLSNKADDLSPNEKENKTLDEQNRSRIHKANESLKNKKLALSPQKSLKSSRSSNIKKTVFNEKTATSMHPPQSPKTPRSKKNQTKSVPQTPDGIASINSDDLLTTPHPAQSTLVIHGRPLSRLSLYLNRSKLACSPIQQSSAGDSPQQLQQEPAKDVQNQDNEEVEVDVIDNDSEPEDCPLISRRAQDIPSQSNDESQSDKSQHTESRNNKSQIRKFQSEKRKVLNDNNFLISPKKNKTTLTASNITEADWARIKIKMEQVKADEEKIMEREEKERLEKAKKKAEIDAQLKRRKAQMEAERKRKARKPIDKAFLVNGKPYKQPRLPRPRKWVTPKLYDYLQKCMEPKFGLETRIRSEKLVHKMVETFDAAIRRKHYKNYEAELDELILLMAKYNIIKTRFDFQRFCADFMPSKIRVKVIPMRLPGNVMNIPFDKTRVFDLIIPEQEDESESSSSGDES